MYRLEHQLPTAIHLAGDMFFLFDQNGVTRVPANGRGAMTRAYLLGPGRLQPRHHAAVSRLPDLTRTRHPSFVAETSPVEGMDQATPRKGCYHRLAAPARDSGHRVRPSSSYQARSLTVHEQERAQARYISGISTRHQVGSMHSRGYHHPVRAPGRSPRRGGTSA